MDRRLHVLVSDVTGEQLDTMTAPANITIRRGMVVRANVLGEVNDLKVVGIRTDELSLVATVRVRQLNWIERAGAWLLDKFGKSGWRA